MSSFLLPLSSRIRTLQHIRAAVLLARMHHPFMPSNTASLGSSALSRAAGGAGRLPSDVRLPRGMILGDVRLVLYTAVLSLLVLYVLCFTVLYTPFQWRLTSQRAIYHAHAMYPIALQTATVCWTICYTNTPVVHTLQHIADTKVASRISIHLVRSILSRSCLKEVVFALVCPSPLN